MDYLLDNQEKQFDYREKQAWMSQNWHWSIYITLAYLTSIYAGQLWMRQRQKYDLRLSLTLWNLTLAVFSICATLRVLPELILLLQMDNGWYHSICSSCADVSPASAFWAWLFVLSKVVELGDTAFIVLRKQPLIFLHWYHHMTVLLYTWHSYADYIAPARWFVVMNYLVHSLMYTYYTLKSLRVRVPKPIAMAITALQLSQMVVGVGVNVYAALTKYQGGNCDISWHHIQMGLCMYASYFLLFIHFFYQAYFSKRTLVAKKNL